MRDLVAAADAGDSAAKLAIEIFCVAIRRRIAAYAAELSGIDMLVFTGGIGEHSARIRDRVCQGLGFLGNVPIKVLPSEEDRQIARHCRALLEALSETA